ncbi:hypothetical protein MHU86_16669 [Fragilaria crotonensis]|nr:hypothetical protein MHU86_16669 [Fragilaria crotonensis]
MKKKADQYASHLRSPRLTQKDIKVFHRSVYSPAMKYSLPALAIDEEELECVQSKIIPTIVQRLGFSSKMATAIRYGPTSMGGLNLMDLRTECGIEMIKYFRHEVYGNTNVGQLLLLQIQASQLEAGLPVNLLEEPTVHIPYLTPTWILSMRQFMSNHNIRITVTDPYHLRLRGSSDQYIMDLNRLKGYTPRQQKDINMVRLHLQSITLLDLVDRSDDTKIATWALEARRPSDFLEDESWPRQPVLGASMRRIWRRYISSQFLRYDRFWKEPPGHVIHRHGAENVSLPTTSAIPGSTISQAIKQLPRHRRRLLSHVRQLTSSDRLWEACQTKQTLTIASDGGLKGRQGTFGWLVTTPSDEILVEGAGPVDGSFDTSNSTRCELGGYAASLLFLSLLTSFWGKRHKCKFRWLTDSKGAIAKVRRHSSQHLQIKQRQPSNADYLGIIQAETTAIRRRIKSVWVKGHQVSTAGRGNRRDIKWNNHADSLATWYRGQKTQRQSVEHTDHTPEARVSIVINGVRVVGQEEESLRYHINGYHLRQYIQSRQKWTNQVWDRIDIEVFGAFHNRLSHRAQTAHTKFVFEQWHTGNKRFQTANTKDDNLDKCPCCRAHGESWQHVLQCVHNPDRATILKDLAKSLTPTDFHPVFPLLRKGIMAWLDGHTYAPDLSGFPTKMWDLIRTAFTDQEKIGWHNALKGYLSVEWRAGRFNWGTSPKIPN